MVINTVYKQGYDIQKSDKHQKKTYILFITDNVAFNFLTTPSDLKFVSS